jgi:hypothetical protein
VKTIAEALGVARSNLVMQAIDATLGRRGRPPQPEAELLAEIKEIIATTLRRRERQVNNHCQSETAYLVLTKTGERAILAPRQRGIIQGMSVEGWVAIITRLLFAGMTVLLAFGWSSKATAVAIVSPSAETNVEGNCNNVFPFDIAPPGFVS